MTLAGLVNQAYPSPEWAVFFEVSNTTGFGASRRADAVALGIWPSRGQALIGFEFKEDRRDWLRERKDPAKADAIANKCDCWYVVAGHDAIVKLDELPHPWGLKVASKDRTRLLTVKEAQPFPDRDKTVIQRTFVAAMLRKVGETTVPKAELQRLVDEAIAAAVTRTSAGRELQQLRETVDRQRDMMQTFENITGVELDRWPGPEKIGAAVKAVMEIGRDHDMLVRAKNQLQAAARDIETALASWPESLARSEALL